MLKFRFYYVFAIFGFLVNPVSAMNNGAGAAPAAAGGNPYEVPPEYNMHQVDYNAQPVEYGDGYVAPAGEAQRVQENEEGNDGRERMQNGYWVPAHLESAQPLIAVLHIDDERFDRFMRTLEEQGKAIQEDIHTAEYAIIINGVRIVLNRELFDHLEIAYPARVDRLQRLRSLVKTVKMGYGLRQFSEWPIKALPVMGGIYALWNIFVPQTLFQWPSTKLKQAEAAMVLYNKINEHARLLIQNSSTSEAMRALVSCKDELAEYLGQTDFNVHLLELPLGSWQNRTFPDIIGPNNVPYILTTYHGNGAVTSQTLFDDEMKFILWRSTAFMLEPLVQYNCARLKNGSTRYSAEQNELLLAYFEGVLQVFADHKWRLRKPYIKKGAIVFGASIVIGALWSNYVRSQKINL